MMLVAVRPISLLITDVIRVVGLCIVEGWSGQEEEDAELDEVLSDEEGDSSEGSEDELAALQAEMAMDLDALKAK